MSDILAKIVFPVTFGLFCLYVLYDVVSAPGRLNGWGYLEAAIFLEILVVVLWDYRRKFFPFLIVVFLAAGTDLHVGSATSARWVVLALGALAGIVIYLKDREHSFAAFHFVALVCIMTALVSALVSSLPRVALLKSMSLLLIFLYGASGARIAVRGREAKFFSGLLFGCEILVYVSAICYFLLHRAIYGNPNSLGAVMGVIALPLLLWGVLISEGTPIGRRRMFALILCTLLLLTSYARAAMVGGGLSALLLCVAMRRYRLLIKGFVVVLVGAMAVAALFPVKPGRAESFIDAFLYKGHEDEGIMGSRKTPWEVTSEIIQRHPWFGAGFGTSATTVEVGQVGTFSTTAESGREHGNSYLAILEWVGLLGVVPFVVLLLMTAFNAGRVMLWVRRTGNPFSPAVPVAAVIIAGLVHATFEDWLFAVGYYVCVFFWAMAFVLIDTVHTSSVQAAPAPLFDPLPQRSWAGIYGSATPGR